MRTLTSPNPSFGVGVSPSRNTSLAEPVASYQTAFTCHLPVRIARTIADICMLRFIAEIGNASATNRIVARAYTF